MTIQSTRSIKTPVHIRWMIRRDFPFVVPIEHASFDFPWCEETFRRVLSQRNCIGMVAECGERVVGFFVYEMHRDHIIVLDFAVDPDCRLRGLGRQMIAKLTGKLSINRRTYLRFFVRESNLAGQLFLKACGFRADRILREHFLDGGEDSYIMTYYLGDFF